MSEGFPEARTTNEPVGPSPELARKNARLGLALAGISILIAVGAVLVSLIYLQLD